MSLINDALKRAAHNKPPAPAAEGSPMVPAATPAAERFSPVWVVPVMTVVLLGASALFFWKWRQASIQPTPAVASSQPQQAAPVAEAPPATKPQVQISTTVVTRSEFAGQAATAAAPEITPPVPAVANPAPVSAPVSAPAAAPLAAATPAPVITAPVAVAPPASVPAAAPAVISSTPEPTPLRLQAIIFRLKNPSALINGRTVETGDEVAGARVIEIQRKKVILDRHGKRETLDLP
jgi:hypothetical protein